MHPHIEWLGAVAADPLVSNAAVRLAVAIAASAGNSGRYRGRSLPLAAAAQQSSRHQGDLLDTLSRQGFLRVHSNKNGKLDLEILVHCDESAPITKKPFIEVAGSVVGIVSARVARGHPKNIVIYVDGADRMAKLTISRDDAEAIAAALARAGAQSALVATT